MSEELHILEIPAHELKTDDWYFEIGTRYTEKGIWWRTLAEAQVFDQIGSVRDGVLIINQVQMRFVDDDAWYAALSDEKILVRGLKNDYYAMHDEKENNPVSDIYSIDQVERALKSSNIPESSRTGILEHLRDLGEIWAVDDERYTEDDVRLALKSAGLDRNLDSKMAYLEAARAMRRGEIRETTVGMLNREDHGKKIKLEHIQRTWDVLTHVKRLENVPKVLLVLDGYIWDLDEHTTCWVDDSSEEAVADGDR